MSPARSINSTPNAVVGMWFALAAIAMLFIGLTSAYVARRGLDPQWAPISVPSAALTGCAFLITSSLTLELSRQHSNRKWLIVTLAFALAFIGAQILACMELAGAGLYLSTNPHSSFFYVFSVLHGVHVLGGMTALTWVMYGRSAARFNVVALYWHAMSILWIYLLFVLFAWK